MSKAKTPIKSPCIGLTDAAILLGTTPKRLAQADALWRCKMFPQLTRIQHVRRRNDHCGSAVLFVRTQVEALTVKRQQPVTLGIARPMYVALETTTEFPATDKPGERMLRQLGVRFWSERFVGEAGEETDLNRYELSRLCDSAEGISDL